MCVPGRWELRSSAVLNAVVRGELGGADLQRLVSETGFTAACSASHGSTTDSDGEHSSSPEQKTGRSLKGKTSLINQPQSLDKGSDMLTEISHACGGPGWRSGLSALLQPGKEPESGAAAGGSELQV